MGAEIPQVGASVEADREVVSVPVGQRFKSMIGWALFSYGRLADIMISAYAIYVLGWVETNRLYPIWGFWKLYYANIAACFVVLGGFWLLRRRGWRDEANKIMWIMAVFSWMPPVFNAIQLLW